MKSEPTMADLIEASSLGTPAAKKLRARTPPDVAAETVRRANERGRSTPTTEET